MPTVLIADDNKDFTTFLSGCLSLYPDIRVVGIAKNGLEVFDFLQHQIPDILLLDIVMPEMDGIQVLRHIKQMKNQIKPVVFVLAALGSNSVIKQALSLGAEYFFIKPVESEAIVTRIRSIIKKPLTTAD